GPDALSSGHSCCIFVMLTSSKAKGRRTDMRNIANLSQDLLFNPLDPYLSPLARKTLEEGWQSLFRRVVLELLPVDTLAEHFHKTHGRPTRELYSMAGLLFIKEFHHWTAAQAA